MTNELFKKIANLSDEDLRKELMKFPDVLSLRNALKGYMRSSETKASSKEKLIDKVFERRRKSMFISEIGKEKKGKETN